LPTGTKEEQEELGASAMGGGNGQKSKMARERNVEKNKASKGTSISIHPYPDSPSSLAHLIIQSPSDLTLSIDFVSMFACRQPVGEQQEGHERLGAYPVVTAAHALSICLFTLNHTLPSNTQSSCLPSILFLLKFKGFPILPSPSLIPHLNVLTSLFLDPVKEPPRARSRRWRQVTPIFGGGGGRGSPSYVGADWFRCEKVD
jgi:hypothetical protein